MDFEKIYIGHDNPIRLVCKENSSAVDTTLLTKVSVTLNVMLSSTSAAAGLIRWNQAGYESGEIRLMIGNSTMLLAGTYQAPLILFDAVNTNGIVWGMVPIQVLTNPEGSSST
jgi:hypothetical protein